MDKLREPTKIVGSTISSDSAADLNLARDVLASELCVDTEAALARVKAALGMSKRGDRRI